VHRNAKLSPAGRLILVERIAAGRPVAHVAAEMGVSRQAAYRWWRRFRAEGEVGLHDRPSRPRQSPHRTPLGVVRRIEELRRRLKLGPARIGYRLGMASSTVYRVLCRLGLQRLSWLDRPTGRRAPTPAAELGATAQRYTLAVESHTMDTLVMDTLVLES